MNTRAERACMVCAFPKTAQARGYSDFMHVPQFDTRVYKDGGTREYYNTATHDTTTLASVAEQWFERGDEVMVSHSCNPTVTEVWNARKRTRRALAGNGGVKYRYSR